MVARQGQVPASIEESCQNAHLAHYGLSAPKCEQLALPKMVHWADGRPCLHATALVTLTLHR